jgi:hypothetical protein
MSVYVAGLSETIQVLNDLPRKQQKRIIPKAVRAGGGPFLKAVRANAPAMNKTLKRSLIMVVRRYAAGALAVIGQDRGKTRGKGVGKANKSTGGISGRGDLVPIHLVENPTKPHDVAGKPWMAFGGVVRRSIRHPGTRGKYFVRNSARQAEAEAVRSFTNKLAGETIIEAGRLG